MISEKNQKETLELLEYFLDFIDENDKDMLFECYYNLGLVQIKNEDCEDYTNIIKNFKKASEYASTKKLGVSLHYLALSISFVIQKLESIKESEDKITKYITEAIKAYSKSINLSYNGDDRYSLEDILRLLTLVFKYAHIKEVEEILNESFKVISVDSWIRVIPQLIARVNSNQKTINNLIQDILSKTVQVHPQALIFPLTVSSKSTDKTRKSTAEKILNQMRNNYSKIVDEAMCISKEFIRIAILWSEVWFEALENAYQSYSNDEFNQMYETLYPLHIMVENPTTSNELEFKYLYGGLLETAFEYLKKYKSENNKNYLNSCWEIYYKVSNSIQEEIERLSKINLKYTSPFLFKTKNLSIAIPGSYKPHMKEIITIEHFDDEVEVLTTKQKPRKLKIVGSDGKKYNFLLKGHEDLRLDERVMQLLDLINNLLSSNPETTKKDLLITKYEVIVLSSNVGLLGK
jgi:serine/threonine-protein kinase mTOR